MRAVNTDGRFRSRRIGDAPVVFRRGSHAGDRSIVAYAPATWDAVIRIATEYQLTVYDAAYLELAHRIGLPLATLDGDLRKAALAASVALVET